MVPFKLEISEKTPVGKNADGTVKNKYAPIGSVEMYIPTLEEALPFIQTAAVKDGEEGKDENGLPVYKTEEANFLFGAIVASIKVMVRNRVTVKDGKVVVKDGQKIPTTWAELVAEGTRTGGEGFAILREFKEAFGKWVATTGKSEAAQRTLILLAGNRSALQTQDNDKKEKFAGYLAQFAETLTDEQTERFTNVLVKLDEDCKAVADAEDF